MTIGEYFESQKKRERKPFYEPVNEYKTLINKGQIAFVWADATLKKYGVPHTNKDKTKFHWTFTGTNIGPNGNGSKVSINGFEEWTINEEGLIQESKGYFDNKEYERQLKFSTDKK